MFNSSFKCVVIILLIGGCDPENRENVEHLEELKSLVNSLDLTDHVVFLPSFSNAG